jgi:hypothetical protein
VFYTLILDLPFLPKSKPVKDFGIVKNLRIHCNGASSNLQSCSTRDMEAIGQGDVLGTLSDKRGYDCVSTEVPATQYDNSYRDLVS